MDKSTPILKEDLQLIEEKLRSSRELYDERFRNLRREAKLKSIALSLQAKEYERRLDGLNHENERILESQQKSVSLEKFDGSINALHSKVDQSTKSQDDKVSALAKQVYIAVGSIAVYEIIFKYLMK